MIQQKKHVKLAKLRTFLKKNIHFLLKNILLLFIYLLKKLIAKMLYQNIFLNQEIQNTQ